MKRILVLVLLLAVPVLAQEKPPNPFGFYELESYKRDNDNKTYYCHLDSVYVDFSARYYEKRFSDEGYKDLVAASNSSALVWNHEKNRPFRCEEFKELREKMMTKYHEEYKEYLESLPDPGPRGPRARYP